MGLKNDEETHGGVKLQRSSWFVGYTRHSKSKDGGGRVEFGAGKTAQHWR